MLRKIEGNSYNSPIKQFWCKIIYKDENGNTYCDLCVENSEKSLPIVEEKVVEKEVEISKSKEKGKNRIPSHKERKLF